MNLSDRKKEILKAIINDYISTAEPVGSKTIAQKYNLSYSPATIRNEMSELEELGLLEKPHTSAGRIPSSSGYRLYVDQLMQNENRANQALAAAFDEIANKKIKELDKLVEEASKMIARITDYTALAITPTLDKTSIVKFEIITVDPRTFVIVVITSVGMVKNKLVKTETDISEDEVKLLTYVLNESLTQIPITAITAARIDVVRRATGLSILLVPIVEFIAELMEEFQSGKVFLEGSSKLLNFPEYRDVHKAQLLLDYISDDSNLPSNNVITKNIDGVEITIGPENGGGPLSDASMIYAKYNIGDMGQGIIGIVGPTRMDYAKMSSQIKAFAKGMNELIAKGFINDGGNENND